VASVAFVYLIADSLRTLASIGSRLFDVSVKKYKLTAPDGSIYESPEPGKLGGYSNCKDKKYGRMDCGAALEALPKGYAKYRVFFADEVAAIAAGFRPCARCMRERYVTWKAGVTPGAKEYPWKVVP
jgi:hypothetical protein